MSFITSIHCMDGRVQEPLIAYLKSKYSKAQVDTITEPGPCKILADNKDQVLVQNIFARIDISINLHKSDCIAISGHFDCAGNPVSKEIQIRQTKKAINLLKSNFKKVDVIGLWVNEKWQVEKV